MQANRLPMLALVAALLLGGMFVALVEPAEAAPTFGSPQVIGQANQDNLYETFTLGDLVIILHTTDTVLQYVVEVSTDGGATFTTRATGIAATDGGVVAASSAQQIVIADDGKIIRTNDGGVSWTQTTVFTAAGVFMHSVDYSNGVYVTSAQLCLATSTCSTTSAATPDFSIVFSKSVDGGVTWSSPATIETWNNPSTFTSKATAEGNDIVALSATSYSLFYASPTNTGVEFGNPVIHRAQTTNGGANFAISTINDAFETIASSPGYGQAIVVSEDAKSLTVMQPADPGTTVRYGAVDLGGNQWDFTQLSSADFNSASRIRTTRVFTCDAGAQYVVIRQGQSGQDRVFYTAVNEGAIESTAITGETATVSQPNAAFQIGGQIAAVYGETGTGRTVIKKTTSGACGAPDPGILPVALATVNDLVGFDVDPSGTTAIARTSEGDIVQTWDAQNLGAPAGTFDTNCDTTHDDAVSAAIDNVVFLDCNGDDSLAIKSLSLNDPNVPPGCQETANYESFNAEGIDESLAREITDIGAFTVSWEAHDDGQCTATALLLVSTQDGRIGLITGVFNDVLVSKDQVFKQYTASNTPVSLICGNVFEGTSVIDGEELYLTAAAPSASTVVYRWNNNVGDPQLAQVRAFGGALGQQDGLGCSLGELAGAFNPGYTVVSSGSGIRGIDLTTGDQVWYNDEVIPEVDGIDMSLDGRWVVAYTPSTTFILNATTGEVAGSFESPTGDGQFEEVRIDGRGQSAWLAFASAIYRFEVNELTTGDPVDSCIICEEFTNTNTGTGGADPNSDAGGNIAPGVIAPNGWTVTAFNGFLATVLMGATGGGLWAAFGRHWVALLIGTILGFILALLFGLLSLWVLIFVVVVSTAVIFLRIRSAAGGAA